MGWENMTMDDAVPIFEQSIGPLGLDVPPAGEVDFERLIARFRGELRPVVGAVHIRAMTTMAECRAAMLAAGELGCRPLWVSWVSDGDGESPTRVDMLAALFVAEGMGAAAFGVCCPEGDARAQLERLAPYASVPLYALEGERCVMYPYSPAEKDPDAIPCATSAAPCFVTRTVDVGEELACTPDLLEDIIAAEDDPVGAMKIALLEEDDVDIFAQHQYAVQKALCLWSDVPELLEGGLRVYQGRAFYDGTGDMEPDVLERLSNTYGLVIL